MVAEEASAENTDEGVGRGEDVGLGSGEVDEMKVDGAEKAASPSIMSARGLCRRRKMRFSCGILLRLVRYSATCW